MKTDLKPGEMEKLTRNLNVKIPEDMHTALFKLPLRKRRPIYVACRELVHNWLAQKKAN